MPRQAVNRPSHGADTAPRPATVASRGTFQQGNSPIQGYVAYRTLVGYQFERSFDQVWTVRQNVRYMGVDTNTYAVAGGGALGSTALRPD